ncbi:MAG: sodium ion-translocating decarboxylase subunit beta [Chloroflexaceae bacterium]|nr:sodium ion-translocating decarboxylase subunit beta [Chloroflexaceae bacterium]
MIVVGCIFIYLAVAKGFEPLLLVPIGFGIVLGNLPFEEGSNIGIYETGSVLNILYGGVTYGVYPPLIFLGLGAMTDFSSIISQPKLILLGAAAQIGIFLTLLIAVFVGSTFPELGLMTDPTTGQTSVERLIRSASSIGIIGGADGPTAIFLTSQFAPDLLGAIAVSAYSYMALVPVIQPPVMRLLTTKQERLIRMPPPKSPSRIQRVLFPIGASIVCIFIAPDALPLLGMLFFGNLLKESGVTERLANTARNAFIDSVTILLGVTVGASTQASVFLQPQSVVIFVMGAFSFAVATAAGVLFARFMNLFLKEKINPLIGSAGVSAVPHAARVSQVVGQQEDPQNFLIMQALAPNVAGVIGSAIAAGVLLSSLRVMFPGA